MKRIKWAPAALLLGIALNGCATAPAAFHELRATAPQAAAAPVLGQRIMVGPVTLPAALDRPQLLTVGPQGQPQILEFQRWGGPLDKLIAQNLATNLTRQTGIASIYAYPQAGMDDGDFKLLLDVRQLRLQPGQQAELEAVWQLLSTKGGASLAGGYFKQERALSEEGVAAAITGLQQLLQELSGQVAQTLSQQTSRPPPAPMQP